MIADARAAGKPVLVDPKGDDWERYRGATLITPNRAELREVVGQLEVAKRICSRASTKLRAELDFEALLLTRSEEGMTLFTDDGVLHAPADAREVYDVSRRRRHRDRDARRHARRGPAADRAVRSRTARPASWSANSARHRRLRRTLSLMPARASLIALRATHQRNR